MNKSFKVLTLLALGLILTLWLGASAAETINVPASITQEPAAVYAGNPVTLTLKTLKSLYPVSLVNNNNVTVTWGSDGSSWKDNGGLYGTDDPVAEDGEYYVSVFRITKAPDTPGFYDLIGQIYMIIKEPVITFYSSTARWTVQVLPRALPDPAPLPDVIFTGLAFTPDVVMVNPATGAALVKDTDYTLAYLNNLNVGSDTATVTATGIGNWTGTASVTFSITPLIIDWPSANTPQTYTGSPLSVGSDGAWYTWKGIKTATTVGTYYAWLEQTDPANTLWKGISNSGSVLTFYWLILPLPVTPPAANRSQVYTGSELRVGEPGLAYRLDGTPTATIPRLTPYPCTAVLLDKVNTVWTTGGTADIDLSWSILPKPIPVPLANGPFTYDGTEKTGVSHGEGYEILFGGSGVNAGNYAPAVVLKPYYVWNQSVDGGIATIDWVILPKPVANPVASGPFVWDGTGKTGVAAGEGFTVIGGTGTNAGDYTAQATLISGNYVWAGGTKDPLNIPWTIQPGLIDPPAGNLSQVFTGSDLRVAPEEEGYTFTGTPSATNVGTYPCAAVLGDKVNTFWTTGGTADIDLRWAILPKPVPVPAANGPFTYDGTGKTGVSAGEGFTVTGGTGTNAGNYTAQATLLNGSYIWADGTTNPASVGWVILPAPLPAIAPLPAVTYTGIAFMPDVGMLNPANGAALVKDTDYTLTYTNNINAGTATVTVTGKGNYTGAKTVQFVIKPAALPALSTIPDQSYTGLPVTPEISMKNGITGAALVAGTDYTLVYADNIKTGTASATATGIGNWEGTASAAFRIVPVYYPNNTAGTRGLRFRDVMPELTDKWYMFTPVDLSQDGEQVIPVIASNSWYVGHVRLLVGDGSVRITYEMAEGVTVKSAFLAFFPDLQAVTKVEPERLAANALPFDGAFSIQDTLGGDTRVLLYAHFVVDYDNSLPGIRRFFSSGSEYRDIMESLLELMEQGD